MVYHVLTFITWRVVLEVLERPFEFKNFDLNLQFAMSKLVISVTLHIHIETCYFQGQLTITFCWKRLKYHTTCCVSYVHLRLDGVFPYMAQITCENSVLCVMLFKHGLNLQGHLTMTWLQKLLKILDICRFLVRDRFLSSLAQMITIMSRSLGVSGEWNDFISLSPFPLRLYFPWLFDKKI